MGLVYPPFAISKGVQLKVLKAARYDEKAVWEGLLHGWEERGFVMPEQSKSWQIAVGPGFAIHCSKFLLYTCYSLGAAPTALLRCPISVT